MRVEQKTFLSLVSVVSAQLVVPLGAPPPMIGEWTRFCP